LEDLGEHQPQLGITLDSSIAPFLPSTWDRTKVANVTIRQLLRHTSGFVSNGDNDYLSLQNMVQQGPNNSQIGKYKYYNGNYSLLRIILSYLVDGPEAYKQFEWLPAFNARVTGLSYRNYVRGRIFAPLGLSEVDVFHTGPLPETIYFDPNLVAIPDGINIPGKWYDFTANNMVLTAGAGSWTLSAEEFSWFISNLWLGKIISPASLTEILPQDDPNAFAVGLGMFGSSPFLCNGEQWWDYGHNGGGVYLNNSPAGPQGQWITFFNGYTAVLLSNTPGAVNVPMEQCFISALTSTSSKIICPPDIIVPNDLGQCGAVVTFSPNTGGTCGIATIVCSPPSGTLFPVGPTLVTCFDQHASGPLYAPCTFTVTVQDVEPPVIGVNGRLPSLFVSATSPSGAIALFSPSVWDNCAKVSVACTPPSGNLFPIGDTTVHCFATDASLNQSSTTFTVHVKGEAEQIGDLINVVNGMSISNASVKKKLLAHLNAALATLQKNDSAAACQTMQSFIDLIISQRTKIMSATDADYLVTTAQQIRAVLGCSL
jgi:hypothetical protein